MVFDRLHLENFEMQKNGPKINALCGSTFNHINFPGQKFGRIQTQDTCNLDSVCVALFYYTDIGESLWSQGFLEKKPRGTNPRLKTADFPLHPVSP